MTTTGSYNKDYTLYERVGDSSSFKFETSSVSLGTSKAVGLLVGPKSQYTSHTFETT